jgi:serine/threonine-protein kinase
MLHAHVYEPLTIDDAILQQAPPQVVDILRRSLAKAPAERYDSAAEMAEALRAAAEEARLREANYGEALAGDTRSATPRSVTVLVPGQTGSTLAEEQAPDGAGGEAASVYPVKTAAGGQAVRWMWPLALLLVVMLAALGYLARNRLLEPASPPNGVAQAPTVESSLPAAAAESGATAAPTPMPTWTAVYAGASAAQSPLSSPVPTTIIVINPTAVATATPAATSTEAPLAAIPPTATDEPTPIPTNTSPTNTSPTNTSPTNTPQPVATAVTGEGVVVGCPYIVDQALAAAAAELATTAPEEFACADANALHGTGELLPFQRGFMVRIAGDPIIYIYYEDTQQWEQKASRWHEGDPSPSPETTPDAPDLFLPQPEFADLWIDEGRRTLLGFATASQPQQFPAVLQTFPGGILIADAASDQVYLFRRSGLIW